MRLILKYEWMYNKWNLLISWLSFIVSAVFFSVYLLFLKMNTSLRVEGDRYFYTFSTMVILVLGFQVLHLVINYIFSIYRDLKLVNRLRVMRLSILKLLVMRVVLFSILFFLISFLFELLLYNGYVYYYQTTKWAKPFSLYEWVLYLVIIVVNSLLWFKFSLQEKHPLFTFIHMFVFAFYMIFILILKEITVLLMGMVYFIYHLVSLVIYIRKFDEGVK